MADGRDGRRYEGKIHKVKVPEPLWSYCTDTGNASEYIRRLIKRDRDERAGQPRENLDDLETLDPEDRDPAP